MISIAEAVKIIKNETFLLAAETINLDESIGRVLAKEIRAEMDLLPFNRSQMDSLAVRAKRYWKGKGEKPVKLKIIGESAGNIFHRIAFSIKNIQNKIYADHKLLYQNLLSCLFVYQFIKYSFCPKQIERKNSRNAETSYTARADECALGVAAEAFWHGSFADDAEA